MTIAALWIGCDGFVRHVDLDDSSDTDLLGALRDQIKCQYVEAVRLNDDLFMWVDEEGLRNRQPVNYSATRLFRYFMGFHNTVVGNAIITGGPTEDGATTGLSQSAYLALLGTINALTPRESS